MPEEQSQTLAELAAEWAADIRTIQRWKSQGAPFGNRTDMLLWLSTRKHLPAGTVKLLQADTRARRAAAIADAGSLQTGAAHALTRLETSEAAAFADLQAALQGGNAFEIKLSRDGWLRVSESLRKYDLMLEESRRNSGELMPRVELERLASVLVTHFKLACIQSRNLLAPRLVNLEVADIAEELDCALLDFILTAFAASAAKNSPSKLPAWLIAAALKPMADAVTGAEQIVAERAEVFSSLNQQQQTTPTPTP